jgi:hypothetical protein
MRQHSGCVEITGGKGIVWEEMQENLEDLNWQREDRKDERLDEGLSFRLKSRFFFVYFEHLPATTIDGYHGAVSTVLYAF